jgi:methylmalonyl-CoA/ethylmalonyl-CoA epimerase
MADAEKVKIKQVLQIGVVVKDLQEAMEQYWNIFGIGPWYIYTFEPPFMTNTTVHGKPAPYTMKLALAQVGNIQWELIQPLTGSGVYMEFLKQKGGGIHHVACDVGDYDQAVATFEKHGIGVAMSATTSVDTFAQMDTEKRLGAGFEIYKRTADFELPVPEAVYPPPSETG